MVVCAVWTLVELIETNLHIIDRTMDIHYEERNIVKFSDLTENLDIIRNPNNNNLFGFLVGPLTTEAVPIEHNTKAFIEECIESGNIDLAHETLEERGIVSEIREVDEAGNPVPIGIDRISGKAKFSDWFKIISMERQKVLSYKCDGK